MLTYRIALAILRRRQISLYRAHILCTVSKLQIGRPLLAIQSGTFVGPYEILYLQEQRFTGREETWNSGLWRSK